MLVVVLGLFFAVVITLQVRDMIKKELWRELITYGILMILALALSIGVALDIKLPNPQLAAAEKVFIPITRYLDSLLTRI